MGYSNILLAISAGTYRLTLNRPDRLNALTAPMHDEILDVLGRIESDESARVLLITGAGRAFCAGQDLGERDVDAGDLDLGAALERHYNPLIRRLTVLPVPVVCAVNGVAAGAGVNLVAASDISVAERSAKFVQAFSSIGLVPDAGGSWILPRLMGQTKAMAFTLLGGTLTADAAESSGLIWKAVDEEDFECAVDAVVSKLAQGPTFGIVSARRLIRDSWSTPLDVALNAERDAQRACGLSVDYKEGVSAFKEKRIPHFSGAKPPAAAPPKSSQ
jgi:2-(1,2-epoxy-1,2-dihydrophenyl)acetyl-CoA isomerase